MLEGVFRFISGNPEFESLEKGDASRESFRGDVQKSVAADVVATLFCLSIVGDEPTLREKIFGAGLLAACARISSISQKFRFEVIGKDAKDSCCSEEMLKKSQRYSAIGLDWMRNILVGSSTIVALGKVHSLAESVAGNILEASLVGICGLALANFLGNKKCSLSKVVRICSIAESVYRACPEVVGPVAESVISVPIGFNTNVKQAALFSTLALTSIFYISAGVRNIIIPGEFRY